MISIYIYSFHALFYVWVLLAILGLTERETSAYAGILWIPSIVDVVSTRFFLEHYTSLKRVGWNIDELVLFMFFQLAILYIISPFRTDTNIGTLLFLSSVYQLGLLYSISERFHRCALAVLWLCGSVTIIEAMLYGSNIIEYSPCMVIPCLIYSTYVANSITLDDVGNPEELQELL